MPWFSKYDLVQWPLLTASVAGVALACGVAPVMTLPVIARNAVESFLLMMTLKAIKRGYHYFYPPARPMPKSILRRGSSPESLNGSNGAQAKKQKKGVNFSETNLKDNEEALHTALRAANVLQCEWDRFDPETNFLPARFFHTPIEDKYLPPPEQIDDSEIDPTEYISEDSQLRSITEKNTTFNESRYSREHFVNFKRLKQ